MYVRLTYLKFQPGKVEQAKKLYFDELAPVVREQKGNIDCRLLEPVDGNEDYISMTFWDNQEEADAYHSSGVYKQLVDRVRDALATPPVLKVYSSQSIMEHA